MKTNSIVVLFLFFLFQSFAQYKTKIIGKVIDYKTQKPLQSAIVSILNTNYIDLTKFNGIFQIQFINKGIHVLSIKSYGYKDQFIQIEIKNETIIDLGIIALETDLSQEKITGLISISENDLNDENGGSENTSSLLQASRDVFLQAAAYNFGQSRFSIRGIDTKYSNVMINGISMNRVIDGRPQYNNWGGLNDATRNQEFTNGSIPSNYSFGGILGSQEINTRASVYRPGTRISFLNTTTNYSFRTMATTASGMNKNGWAFVLSAGRRWAEEGYFEGTNYSANSFFVSIEKKINTSNSLNFNFIYAQNKRSINTANTQEVTSLVGINYNPFWGYQNNKKRNARVRNIDEPILMLTHYWKVNPKTNLNTTLFYQIGQIGNSRIEYTKVDNPDPTYYKKLPSAGSKEFFSNKQLNWANIYNINKQNLENGSLFILYEDRNDENITQFNSIIDSQISDNVLLTAGVNYFSSKTKNFKNLLDLLGGNFYTDINIYGYGNQQQTDLNNPNRQVRVNDKFGYYYAINTRKIDAFSNFKFIYNKIDFYLAQFFSRSTYQRDGFYKNGYNENYSQGKSKKPIFDNFGFKAGMTYKLSGKNYFDFNGFFITKSPNTREVFSNARTNNTITEGINNETILGGDISYILKIERLKARFTTYFLEILNSTAIKYYYAEAISLGEANTKSLFVTEALTGLNKKNTGFEVGLDYQLFSTIKLTAALAYGNYIISNNPNLNITSDASSSILNYGQSNLKGYKQPGMPQQAYSIGIEYKSPKYWWVGLNANYLSHNYIDVASIKRTDNFIKSDDNYDILINPELVKKYLKQEQFKSFFLFNLVGGKSWKIEKYYLGLFASANNLFNINYKTGGFEQSRNTTYKQEFEDRQMSEAGSFGAKYFYGFGRTYMANIYFTF